jgi:hypothetical protein
MNLKHLDLSTNNLTNVGLAALRSSAWFQQLESLEVNGNRIGNKMAA